MPVPAGNWAYGRNISGRGDAVSPRCRTSPTMPTTVRQTESASPPPSSTRRPTASPSGQTCRGERPVHDHRARRAEPVGGGEVPALQQRNAHGARSSPGLTTCQSAGCQSARKRRRGACPSSTNDQSPISSLPVIGSARAAAAELHARDVPQALEQARVEAAALRRWSRYRTGESSTRAVSRRSGRSPGPPAGGGGSSGPGDPPRSPAPARAATCPATRARRTRWRPPAGVPARPPSVSAPVRSRARRAARAPARTGCR